MKECVLREYYKRVRKAECLNFMPFFLIYGKWINIQMDDDMDKLFINGIYERILK